MKITLFSLFFFILFGGAFANPINDICFNDDVNPVVASDNCEALDTVDETNALRILVTFCWGRQRRKPASITCRDCRGWGMCVITRWVWFRAQSKKTSKSGPQAYIYLKEGKKELIAYQLEFDLNSISAAEQKEHFKDGVFNMEGGFSTEITDRDTGRPIKIDIPAGKYRLQKSDGKLLMKW